jgi:regulator of sigma E protease
MTFLEPLAVFALALSILLLVHEWGHYWVGRRFGVRVLRFSLGFGPEIAGYTRGDTRFSIRGIPFGGYVLFAGSDPEEEREHLPDDLLAQSIPVRSAIVLAGPVMNFLLAIFLFAVVLYAQGIPVLPDTRIGSVAEDSVAETMGLLPDDEIRRVNGVDVEGWIEFSRELGKVGAGQVLTLTVDRAGETLELRGSAPEDDGFGGTLFGVVYHIEPIAGTVKRGAPAWNAGLRKGDLVRSVDGEPVDHWSALVGLIQARPGQEVTIAWVRNGHEFESRVTPAPIEVTGEDGEPMTIGQIGIEPGTELERVGALAAIAGGWSRTWWITSEVFKILPRLPVTLGRGLLRMIQGKAAGDEGLGGPVRMAQLFGEAARWGLFHFLAILASISTQLAIFNLLPIPVLDGGHLSLYAVEAVTRRPPSIRIRLILQQFGFALLLLLMLSVTVMDVGRFFG